MRQNGVDGCRWLGVVCLALCFLAGVPAVATESSITSSGSGFIVTSDGYILTNEHVVGDSETVTVFVEGTGYPATVVTKSAESDLALLKIAASDLTPVALGNSLQVQLLDDVVALGYPLPQFGRDLTVSEGRITSFRTNVEGREGRDTLQHDAVITHGSSGGPLFSLKGEVIGVNFAGVKGSGMQLAIPINETVPLLRSIPSFSPSKMGVATQALTAQQVASACTSSVVYIEVSSVINWQGVLPSPSSVQVSPEERVYETWLWEDWLVSLGFRVSGAARITNGSEWARRAGYENDVIMVVLQDEQSARLVAELWLGQSPPRPEYLTEKCTSSSSTPIATGTAVLAGQPIAYRLSCEGSYCCDQIPYDDHGNFYWGSPCYRDARITGILVFTLGSLAFRVRYAWGDTLEEFVLWARRFEPLFHDGYLYADEQRLISAQEVLNRLEQLAQLIIVTATNYLTGQ